MQLGLTRPKEKESTLQAEEKTSRKVLWQEKQSTVKEVNGGQCAGHGA